MPVDLRDATTASFQTNADTNCNHLLPAPKQGMDRLPPYFAPYSYVKPRSAGLPGLLEGLF